ncbi:PaaI family thioesterase [Rathayibacter caricis]|uniref:PaaI family thioesterase n=1 Tax=Rathayibacter caricis TaxID=110936 RepID=UPI001FB4B733|nr:PaaI family thioesterase [Rathayibacter caricis]MCJ1697992.1 PaaI family thioesterase [Rathayibacter caricis]
MTHDSNKPALDARVRRSFDRQGLMRHLGAELTGVRPGAVTIRLPVRDELTQQHGHVHAGAVSTIADSAGGYAALTLLDEDSEVLTVEYKINLLAPARGEYLEAEGTVLRSGRTLTVCRLDVRAVNGEARTPIAVGQQTLIRVDTVTDER